MIQQSRCDSSVQDRDNVMIPPFKTGIDMLDKEYKYTLWSDCPTRTSRSDAAIQVNYNIMTEQST